jgi:hypothetical protein
LETAAGFRPTGLGSVCFRAVEGGEFSRVQADIQALLDVDQGPKVDASNDSYGYTWLLARHDPTQVAQLVTDLHAINSTLADNGYGPTLLCSLVSFAETGGAGRRVALVYLYKRGTFYPFAPLPGERRDNALELQVRGVVGEDLRVEPELGRWFPVWGAPGL